ncbi:hypothetical protein Tco_0576431 [Tanacetum coccineum]
MKIVGPQEPEPNVSDDRSSKYSTCQSNDSAGSIRTSSEHSVDPESKISNVPPEVYVSTPVTTNEKELECYDGKRTRGRLTPKVNRKNWNAMMERELEEGYSFTKKKCFVCGSLSHLIKDCDYYEKKIAESTDESRIIVQIKDGRPNINSVRPNDNTGRVNVNSVKSNVNTGRTNVNPVRPRVNTGSSNVNTVRSKQPVPTRTSNSFSPKRPHVNLFNQRKHFSKSHSFVRRPFAKITAQMSHSYAVKENRGSAVKTSAGSIIGDKGIFDSGTAHGHMTSFDMKTPTPAKGFACLIAKATSDESKLWHRSVEVLVKTPYSNASEEKDKDVELIVVPSTVKNTEEKAESRKSSTNSRIEEILLIRTHTREEAYLLTIRR